MPTASPSDRDLSRAASLTLDERISLLSGSDVWHTQPIDSAGVTTVMLSDGPHGLRKQEVGGDHLGTTGSNPATCYPTAATLGSSWDVDLLRAVGEAVGTEARAEGVSVVLGPGLNIKRHPNCGRNFEYLSEDPLLSGRLASAIVDGIQSQGIGACLKHFAVNNQESYRLVVDAVLDERTLREIYLAGFELAVTASKPWTVMAAYNRVNGVYCCDSHRLLTTILREEWGFQGLVMSDWGATNDRVAGVAAGMDLEMPASGGVNDPVVHRAVEQGDLAEDSLTTSAARVLELVSRAPSGDAPAADLGAHHDLARRAAAESTVLLTNNGILPLSAPGSIALIGAFGRKPRFQGAGSSLVNPVRVDAAWDALRDRVPDGVAVRYAAGYDPITSEQDSRLLEEAVAAAKACDVVVLMVGLPAAYESEGFDRQHMRLPDQHEDLISAICAANHNTVVTLSNGAPVTMPWVDEPAAILESYLGGQASGSALVDVLFGDREPSGRLAETFPIRQSDVPSDPFFPGRPRQVEYREGLYVGYRYFTTADVPVRFPFGHGLSYTSFDYGEPTVSAAEITPDQTVAVSVTVTNTGERTGADVVQIYVRDTESGIHRPDRELRAFRKVRLEPGASAEVVVELDARAFAVYDVTSAGWRVEGGDFDILVGASCQDIRGSARVTVRSDWQPTPDPGPTGHVAATDGEFARLLGRTVPEPPPTRPFTRLTTVGELQATPVGRAVRFALHQVTRKQFEEMSGGDAALRTMLSQALDETPLRAVVLLGDGRITWPMLDRLIDVLNGRTMANVGSAALSAPGSLYAWVKGLVSRE